jgi:glycosyltransferase involved in cell wall biosynthesis
VKLIIINYSMSSESLVFSHQRDVVISLSRRFESIEVFTPEVSQDFLPDNVKVFELKWTKKAPLRNALIILKTLVPYLIRNRNTPVFTHMTDVHAALISPLTFILRMRHVLWYAHATNSIYLIWASFFVSKIVSSTSGSCNLNMNTRKILYINQGIEQRDFPFHYRSFDYIGKFLYYGRLDKSKNIHVLLELIQVLNGNTNLYTIDLYGKSAGSDSESYLEELRSNPLVKNPNSPVTFNNPITRKDISSISQQFDCFLNLFSGSLDKTLIESTFMGLPVVTWNKEFCNQFGTWSGKPVEETLNFIVEEIISLQQMNKLALRKEVERRYELASRFHSYDGWIDRLTSILKPDSA